MTGSPSPDSAQRSTRLWAIACALLTLPFAAILHHAVFFRPTCMLNRFGPEYTPDGAWIWFNSTRSGQMQLWRMRADGSAPERMTRDGFNDWFPHVSPDGKWLAYIAFPPEVPAEATRNCTSRRQADCPAGAMFCPAQLTVT